MLQDLEDMVREAFAPHGVLSRAADQFRPRQGQTDMAVAVGRTIGQGGALVVENAGLSADTLSQGQKQLFSLGRAILRRRVRAAAEPSGPVAGVLLLDEVSSSVDQDTDRAMQTVIRDEFAGYTVIMVSHRLDMVLATCDTVVVLDQGRVVETGAPAVLVEAEGTRFRELWLVGKKA